MYMFIITFNFLSREMSVQYAAIRQHFPHTLLIEFCPE